MSEAWLSLTGLLHGSLGAGVLALLALAVWLEARGEDESFGSALMFASLLQVGQLILGGMRHVTYEQQYKQALLARMPGLGWWLLRKEHLAVGAACLVWLALASWWVGHKRGEAPGGRAFTRSAATSARLAAALYLVVFALGSIVAAGIEDAIAPH